MPAREVLLLVMCGAFACDRKLHSNAATDEQLQAQALLSTTEARNYVYRITCSKTETRASEGTAFVHRSGLLITAAHVVRECIPGTIRSGRGRVMVGLKVLLRDDIADLAVLEPESKMAGGLSLSPALQPSMGTSLSSMTSREAVATELRQLTLRMRQDPERQP